MLQQIIYTCQNQELTAFEAISLFTTGSAKAIGKEHVRGKIMSGYDADFTIVDQVLTKETFATSKVLQTVVNGEIVFSRKK